LTPIRSSGPGVPGVAQIHRSVIVNMNAVSSTRRDLTGKLYVLIRDHSRELPVARHVHLFRQM
jgi:DNA-binding LytR/AlgR family response regulator